MMVRSSDGAAKLGATLSSLEALLALQQPPPKLRPPIAGTTLAQLARALPYSLPDVVRAVYEWHDGEEGPPGFLEEFRLMPFHHVVQHVTQTGTLYPPRWLPLLTNWGGDFLYIVVNGKAEPVLLWRVYDQIRDFPVYDSLTTFFETVLEGHRAGVFRTVKRGSQELQGDGSYRKLDWLALEVRQRRKWHAIQGRLNPLANARKNR